MKPILLRKTKSVQKFRALSRKLGTMVDNGSFFELSREKQLALAKQLRQLYRTVGMIFSGFRLRRTLTSAALLLGMAGSMQAQYFAAPVESPFNLHSENAPIFHFADIDGDGDQDAFMSINSTNPLRNISFQENIGTPESAVFDTLQFNYLNLADNFPDPLVATTIDLSDVDMDGDLDLFTGAFGISPLAPIYSWENLGTATNPVFSAEEVMTDPMGLQPTNEVSLFAFADLDNDGDEDILMNEYGADTFEQFRYQENEGIVGDLPVFGTPQINPFGLTNENLVRIFMDFADFDSDGDLDMLLAGQNDFFDYVDTYFYYYENTGTPTSPAFGTPVTNPFNLQLPANTYILLPTIVDIDNDGDMDIIASIYDLATETSRVYFWENLDEDTSVKDIHTTNQVSVFPSVADEFIQWEMRMEKTVSKSNLQIVDMHGRTVYSEVQKMNIGINQGELYTNSFASGMYVLHISDD